MGGRGLHVRPVVNRGNPVSPPRCPESAAAQDQANPSLGNAVATKQHLTDHGIGMTEEQLATISSADQTNDPLFLRAVLEELVVFGVFEELDKRIKDLLRL